MENDDCILDFQCDCFKESHCMRDERKFSSSWKTACQFYICLKQYESLFIDRQKFATDDVSRGREIVTRFCT